MTRNRKRFIKMMMSVGYSRNQAVQSVNTNITKVSLKECFIAVKWFKNRSTHCRISHPVYTITKMSR